MDATDAVAVALCHHYQSRMPGKTEGNNIIKNKAKKANGWGAFLAENPGRVKR